MTKRKAAKPVKAWAAFYTNANGPVISSFKIAAVAADEWSPSGHLLMLSRKDVIRVFGHGHRIVRVEISEVVPKRKRRTKNA